MVKTIDGLQFPSDIELFGLEVKIIYSRMIQIMRSEHFQPFVRLVGSPYILDFLLVIRLRDA
jgi:hypothetical protein